MFHMGLNKRHAINQFINMNPLNLKGLSTCVACSYLFFFLFMLVYVLLKAAEIEISKFVMFPIPIDYYLFLIALYYFLHCYLSFFLHYLFAFPHLGVYILRVFPV